MLKARHAVEFQSFFQGGFESATHRRRDGVRLDILRSSGHDVRCREDYRLLSAAGILTVRDAFRWHLIEQTPGCYNWSSIDPMLQAALETGTEVIWDLCHWGVPDGIDLFSAEFVERFAAYAAAAANRLCEFHSEHEMPPPAICAINEISFWSWAAGEVGYFASSVNGMGDHLKRQLIAASVSALRIIRELCPAARVIQPEPLIHVSAALDVPDDLPVAAQHSAAQFEAVDMLLGRLAPELGGHADLLDVVGVNYYWDNQWVHSGPRTPLGHILHKPLHLLLEEVWHRYGKPLLVTETGAEDGDGAGWLAYVMAEIRQAEAEGVQVAGVCIYPVMDYPGWDDERHCPVGLLHTSRDWAERWIDGPLRSELLLQQKIRADVQ